MMRRSCVIDENFFSYKSIFYHKHVLLLLSNSVSIPQNDYDLCRSKRYLDTMIDLNNIIPTINIASIMLISNSIPLFKGG